MSHLLSGYKRVGRPQAEMLPRSARLCLSLIGLLSLLAGLSLGFYVLLAVGMSYGHGGDPVHDARVLLLILLPMPLIGAGVFGLICSTLRRLVVMCLFFLLFIADITVLSYL